jgi:hypothetical protein
MSKLIYKATDGYSMGWTDPRERYADPPDRTVREILSGAIPLDHRPYALSGVMRFDLNIASTGNLNPTMAYDMADRNDDNIYRVSIFPDGVDIVCFGLSSVDSELEGHYDDTDDLPQWVKERLAVLMITSDIPPTVEVVGVGRRISSHVYWVYAPETTS